MPVRIFIPNQIFDRLRRSIPRDSRTRQNVDHSPLLGNTRVIECNATEAKEFLVKAKVYCPDAVESIYEAIQKMPER